MKISQMLQREDFYLINEKTLSTFFGDSDNNIKSVFYVYPHLNAIISKTPSKDVKAYLYAEFSVAGLVKRLIVKCYLFFLLNSFGVFASKRIKISVNLYNIDSFLIYPCNRKIRVFNFNDNKVNVIVKSGFSNESLKKEILFRTKYSYEFILPIVLSEEYLYIEEIIDGYPLAREVNESKYKKYCLQAIECLNVLQQNNFKLVPMSDYLSTLKQQIVKQTNILSKTKNTNSEMILKVAEELKNICLEYSGEIPIALSHGDLQPGNIWINNENGKIIIIDWESYDTRSIWYDRFLLLYNLRNIGDFAKITDDIYNNIELDVCHLLDNKIVLVCLVLLEDIIYRLNELYELPLKYGKDEFDNYICCISNISDRIGE